MPIPLLMILELRKHHDNDRMEHQLRVGVVGVEEPITAEIESEFYRNPSVKNSWGGGLSLPGSLEDAFIVTCFNHLAVNPVDSPIREVFTPDATHWNQHQLQLDRRPHPSDRITAPRYPWSRTGRRPVHVHDPNSAAC